MPQLIIRADHTVRVSAAAATEEGLWIRRAVLTASASGAVVEATSPPCADPDLALVEVLAAVRRKAGFPASASPEADGLSPG